MTGTLTNIDHSQPAANLTASVDLSPISALLQDLIRVADFAARREWPSTDVNVAAPQVSVAAPAVHVAVPDSPPPVYSPQIHVPPAQVTVEARPSQGPVKALAFLVGCDILIRLLELVRGL